MELGDAIPPISLKRIGEGTFILSQGKRGMGRELGSEREGGRRKKAARQLARRGKQTTSVQLPRYEIPSALTPSCLLRVLHHCLVMKSQNIDFQSSRGKKFKQLTSQSVKHTCQKQASLCKQRSNSASSASDSPAINVRGD